MGNLSDKVDKKPGLGWGLFIFTIIVVFALGLLASSIVNRKAEAAVMAKPAGAEDIQKLEPRNEVWGKSYPRQYETYMDTKDTSFKSKHGGGAMIDMLEVDPRLVVLWAGYGFSKEYNQGRGHAYAIEDMRNILRTGGPKDETDGPMPGTCWTCKSPDVPRFMAEKGNGDIRAGAAELYKGKWAAKGAEIVNPIGCADCHDEKTMKLTITRPALVEAFERQGKDITKATHQEMRSLVCAQCHVEYYFKGKDKYLTFPWDKGMTVEDMEEYFDEYEFSDWTHKLSKAPMLKAQHPDYELFLSGIHAQRGVSCADCHMPYKTEGSQKFTDHKLQSPLNNIANSCQVCHRESEGELLKNVYERQDKIIEGRDELEKLLVRAHLEAKAAWEAGAKEEQMKDALKAIRHAQWRWDYIAASHGGAFHAPVETARVLATGLTKVGEARMKLQRILFDLGVKEEIPYPTEELKNKASAQKFIGLDMDKLNKEKAEFLKNLAPKWDEEAKKREATYDQKK